MGTHKVDSDTQVTVHLRARRMSMIWVSAGPMGIRTKIVVMV